MGARTHSSYSALWARQYALVLSASSPSKKVTASAGQPRNAIAPACPTLCAPCPVLRSVEVLREPLAVRAEAGGELLVGDAEVGAVVRVSPVLVGRVVGAPRHHAI